MSGGMRFPAPCCKEKAPSPWTPTSLSWVGGRALGGAALLWGGFFPPFIPFCLVVVEEDKELALKEEEVLPCEAPPEAPRQPSPPVAAEDGDGGEASAIIYEIPQEPEKSVVVGGGS